MAETAPEPARNGSVMALAILASQPDRTALAKGNNLLHLHEVRQAANLKAQPELLAVLGHGTNVNPQRRVLIDHQGAFPAVPQPQRGLGTRTFWRHDLEVKAYRVRRPEHEESTCQQERNGDRNDERNGKPRQRDAPCRRGVKDQAITALAQRFDAAVVHAGCRERAPQAADDTGQRGIGNDPPRPGAIHQFVARPYPARFARQQIQHRDSLRFKAECTRRPLDFVEFGAYFQPADPWRHYLSVPIL